MLTLVSRPPSRIRKLGSLFWLAPAAPSVRRSAIHRGVRVLREYDGQASRFLDAVPCSSLIHEGKGQ